MHVRTLRLRTVHACDGPPCPHCHLVEGALRRALGLAGFSMPDHVEGRPSREAHVSGSVTVLIEHECDEQDAAHVEFYIDEERVELPRGGTATSLQRTFSRFLDDAEKKAAPRPSE